MNINLKIPDETTCPCGCFESRLAAVRERRETLSMRPSVPAVWVDQPEATVVDSLSSSINGCSGQWQLGRTSSDTASARAASATVAAGAGAVGRARHIYMAALSSCRRAPITHRGGCQTIAARHSSPRSPRCADFEY